MDRRDDVGGRVGTIIPISGVVTRVPMSAGELRVRGRRRWPWLCGLAMIVSSPVVAALAGPMYAVAPLALGTIVGFVAVSRWR